MTAKQKGPFDAAVNELHGVIAEAKEVGGWDGLIVEYRAAIRVLKAAGKVANPRATELAFLTIIDEARVDEDNQFVCEISTILKSLPEHKEER